MPSAYCFAYLPMTALLKSYSSSISTSSFFSSLIVSSFTRSRCSSANDSYNLTTIGMHHNQGVLQPDWPRTTNLSSASECKGSGIVRDNGSAKTVEASENETACFVRFSAAFCSSHSNVKLMRDNIRRHEKRRKALNFMYLTFSRRPLPIRSTTRGNGCSSIPDTAKPDTDIKTAFGTTCELAEIENLPWHDLRHTFGTRLAEAGCSEATIANLMGHSDPQTTRRYTHATDRAKRAALEAVRLRFCHNPATKQERPPLQVAVIALINWSGREDSNLRPHGPEPCALPG